MTSATAGAHSGPMDCDLLIVGSGIGGLTAALTASVYGLRVMVLEKETLIGGTSAYSEAMVWVPCSRQARSAGLTDSVDDAANYLDAAAQGRADPRLIRAFVSTAAEALEFVETNAGIHYELTTGSVDYLPGLPGATAGCRALTPLPYDGRALGKEFAKLRWPLPTTMIFGGMSIHRPQFAPLLRGGPIAALNRDRDWLVYSLPDRPPARFSPRHCPDGRKRGRRCAPGGTEQTRRADSAERGGDGTSPTE